MIGKAVLNVPVTQMVKTGGMRRSVQAVTSPLVSQLKEDILQHGENSDSENRPADCLGYVGSGESSGSFSLNPRNHEENVTLLALLESVGIICSSLKTPRRTPATIKPIQAGRYNLGIRIRPADNVQIRICVPKADRGLSPKPISYDGPFIDSHTELCFHQYSIC